MSHFQLTPDAQSDLIEIRRYTAKQWGNAQSHKYLSELRQTLQLLAETPSIGKPRPDVGATAMSFPYVSHVNNFLRPFSQTCVSECAAKPLV